jgi:hypothetical protein
MARKKTTSGDLTAIRIGSRVRFGDSMTGRIIWANATSAKIQWDDGEKVTWKRAELATKGVEILGEVDAESPAATSTAAVYEPAAAPEAVEAVTPETEPPAPESAETTIDVSKLFAAELIAPTETAIPQRNHRIDQAT